jgi:hypothetical protein
MLAWNPHNDPPPKQFVMRRDLWNKLVAQIPQMSPEERLGIDPQQMLFASIPIRIFETDEQCKLYCITQMNAKVMTVWLSENS